MKKSLLTALLALLLLLAGCGKSTPEQEEQDTIRVYLWSSNLYEKYAPYVQSQLPDINIQFVVGNNDLDFYTFLEKNGGLPDIITCCRFSLHDASPLKDSLMDLSTTNEAGAVYSSYLNSFLNEDGTVNWLPVCADAHGMVVNRGLFQKYHIPLPTDYDSFVAACKVFESYGLRGFTADLAYDYTCMEMLQGLSATQLSSAAGQSSAGPTANRRIRTGWAWTRKSGPGPLSGWSGSSGMQVWGQKTRNTAIPRSQSFLETKKLPCTLAPPPGCGFSGSRAWMPSSCPFSGKAGTGGW